MSNQQPALLCRYRYDPLDRLINHTLPDTPTLQRFYCKNRLATEIQGAMQHSIVQHGGQLLAQQQREGDVVDNTLLATDQQRSVLHTLDKNHTPQTIAYSPYGHRRFESGLSSLLGFTGERPDPVTRHYLLGNGYRAFNSVLMRFNSPDSLSPFGKGGLNSYVYCIGDPVNFVDPTGHVITIPKIPRITPNSFIPKVKNVQPINSLEGLDYDSFSKISKFLDQSDMDNLAKTSHQLNKHSVLASESNLKSLISRAKSAGDKVPSTRGRFNSIRESAEGKIVEVSYAIQGIGSSAFKKLDNTIQGPKSLTLHHDKIRRGLKSGIHKRVAMSEGDGRVVRALNIEQADVLLSALEGSALSLRETP